MSVLRQLVDQQLAITPSMEAASLERGLDEMHSQVYFLINTIQQVSTDTLSTESKIVLEALGYSTEAEEKKGLIARIWEGIKKIFGKIKEFISRLIAMRKHYLKNNELKIEKIKKYVHAIPTERKPSGKIRAFTALLPQDPSKALSAISSFRTQGEAVMSYRNQSLETLQGMDIKQLMTKHVEDFTHILYGPGSRVEHGRREAVFTQEHDDISYQVAGYYRDQNLKEIPAPSVMTMHSLITQYEKLLEDDIKFIREVEKRQVDADHFVTKLGNMKEDNAFARNMLGTDEEREKARHAWGEAARMIRVVDSVSRLTHAHVWSALFDDIQTILQKSLGAYKFKEDEVKDEDRTDKKKDDNHENK